jgi:C-terminal processing protease CtpA/Prc
MPLTPTARRVVGTLGAAAALSSAFTVGVVAGAGSGQVVDRTPPVAAAGVLDDAATQIADQSLHPVDRDRLAAAAIDGMLRAAGDPWGSWSTGTRTPALTPTAAVVSAALEHAGPAGPPVGRIVVTSFRRGTGRDVRAALARLRAGRVVGVVLDLRGNPGGLLDEAVETASAFLDGGRVVSYARRGAAPVRLDAVGTGDVTTSLVVLVDGGTASAAEVVAGALQDRGRAVLVGSRTFGKGTVQEPRRLSDGSALELTVAHYATPLGRSVDGVGLTPDIDIAAGAAPDVAVRRALQVLTGLVADRTAGGARR